MLVPVFVFLLVVCPFLCLALLWRHDWFHLRPSSSRGGAKRGTLHHLLKPRSPDDCPACRLGSTPSMGGGTASTEAASLEWGEKPPESSQAHRYRRLRLSEPAVPLLWHH